MGAEGRGAGRAGRKGTLTASSQPLQAGRGHHESPQRKQDLDMAVTLLLPRPQALALCELLMSAHFLHSVHSTHSCGAGSVHLEGWNEEQEPPPAHAELEGHRESPSHGRRANPSWFRWVHTLPLPSSPSPRDLITKHTRARVHTHARRLRTHPWAQ